MKATTGTYQTQEIGKRFFVVFKWNDGETMIMSKPYATESGASRKMQLVKRLAGA